MNLHINLGRLRLPSPRLEVAAFVLLLMLSLVNVNRSFAADAVFERWLASLWPQAQAMGVSRATFETATRGLEPDFSLPDLAVSGRPEAPQRGQAEFVQTPADYLKETTISRLAAQGAQLRE